MFVKVLSLSVSTSNSNKIPLEVPAHEIPLLQNIHGEENIYDPTPVDGAVELDPKNEYQRLCSKYSDQVVGEVFGGQGSATLKQAMLENEFKPPKAPKSDANKSDAKGD